MMCLTFSSSQHLHLILDYVTVNYGKITKAATWSRKEHAVRSAEMRQRNHSKRRWHSHKNLGQKDLGNINQFDHLTCLT